MTPLPVPAWDEERLELDRRVAIGLFREERMKEPLEAYLQSFDHYVGVVEDLLEMTVDLAEIFERAEQVLTDRDLLYAVRYLAGPMISKDDLVTLADTSIAPSVLRKDPDRMQDVLETIVLGLDRRRFPWVVEEREPTEAERYAAIVATAALIATQRVRTERANESAAEQQTAVIEALKAIDFTEVPRRVVNTLRDAPGAGEVCRSGMFGGRDADMVAGLWDGRTLVIECKVSNSSTNSVKRLNNDTAAKAEQWIRDFGRRQVAPIAVLSGVFKLHNLQAAQDVGLTIVWAHKLEALTEWIEDTRRHAP
jgi:XamI restriction endonuclease